MPFIRVKSIDRNTLLQTAYVQINIAFSLCTEIFTEKKLMRNLHTSHPVKIAHNKQNTHKVIKIIWKYINWILVGVKIGAKMLLENVKCFLRQRKHKMTSIPKKDPLQKWHSDTFIM